MRSDSFKSFLLIASWMALTFLIFSYFYKSEDSIKKSDANTMNINLISKNNLDVLPIEWEGWKIITKVNMNNGSLYDMYLPEYKLSMDQQIILDWNKEWTQPWTLIEKNKDFVQIQNQTNDMLLVTRTFKWKDDYLLEIMDEVKNQSTEDTKNLFPHIYLMQQEHSQNLSESFIIKQQALTVNNNLMKEFGFSEIKTQTYNIAENPEWVGFISRFLMSSLINLDSNSNHVNYKNPKIQLFYDNEYYVGSITNLSPYILSPGQIITQKNQLYLGLKDPNTLSTYEKKHQISKLGNSISWGWFFFTTKPLYFMLEWLFELGLNPVLAIFALVLIVKLLLLPLSYQGYIMSKKMHKIQGKIEEIKSQCTDNSQKLSENILKLYQKHKINPLLGVMSLFIQIPVFFSLYKITYMFLGFQGISWLWIENLATADTTNILSFIGVSWLTLSFLAGIASISMFAQISSNGISMHIAAALSLLVGVLISYLPAAALLYIIFNNIITIAQQIGINWYIQKQQ